VGDAPWRGGHALRVEEDRVRVRHLILFGDPRPLLYCCFPRPSLLLVAVSARFRNPS
jgi:hypothetical protein